MKFTQNITENISHWNELKRSSLAVKLLPRSKSAAAGIDLTLRKLSDRVKVENHRAIEVTGKRRCLKETLSVVESMHHIPVKTLNLNEENKDSTRPRNSSGNLDQLLTTKSMIE